MTKKRFLVVSCLAAMLSLTSISVYADPEVVSLLVGYVDPTFGNDDQQKSPILIPKISLDDYPELFIAR